MKSIPAFSKEMVDGNTVSNDEDGCREGFLDYIKSTKCDAGKPVPNMAAFYPTASTLERTKAGGNPAHPEFKGGGKNVSFPAAYSKTSIKGGPR